MLIICSQIQMVLLPSDDTTRRTTVRRNKYKRAYDEKLQGISTASMDEDLGIPGDWSCVRFVGMKSLSTLTFWLGAKLQLNPAGVCNSILIIVSLDFFYYSSSCFTFTVTITMLSISFHNNTTLIIIHYSAWSQRFVQFF
jgi:hypothetical protein